MLFDPDVSQTLRLEFARSNTKVSKPVNKQAVLTSAPAFYPREPQLSKDLECYVFSELQRLFTYKLFHDVIGYFKLFPFPTFHVFVF